MTEHKKEITKTYPLRTIVEANPTEDDYRRYVELLLEKVKDRYDKALFKYFREIEGEEPSFENYFLLQMYIEPEDLQHFVKMNREFVLNNLNNEKVNEYFYQLLPEYIDLEGTHVLFRKHKVLGYTNVSSIAQDSTIVVLIAFVRESDAEKVEASIDARIQEIDAEQAENKKS